MIIYKCNNYNYTLFKCSIIVIYFYFFQNKMAALWKLRETIAQAANTRGAVYKFDISLPVRQMYGFVHEVRSHLTLKKKFLERSAS